MSFLSVKCSQETALQAWQSQLYRCRQQRREPDPQCWDRLCSWYDSWVENNDYVDQVLPILLQCLQPTSRVLEIGPGTGAFTLPLASRVQQVVGIEPSPGMRRVLTGKLEQSGVGNVVLVAGRVEDRLDDISGPFDVALVSHSLYNVAPVDRVLRQLLGLARHVVVLIGTGTHSEWYQSLINRFDGQMKSDSSPCVTQIRPAGGTTTFGSARSQTATRSHYSLCPLSSQQVEDNLSEGVGENSQNTGQSGKTPHFGLLYPVLLDMGIWADVQVMWTSNNYVYPDWEVMVDWWMERLKLEPSRREELSQALLQVAQVREDKVGIFEHRRTALVWIDRERHVFGDLMEKTIPDGNSATVAPTLFSWSTKTDSHETGFLAELALKNDSAPGT
jgi:precorrin-6B methylase 2